MAEGGATDWIWQALLSTRRLTDNGGSLIDLRAYRYGERANLRDAINGLLRGGKYSVLETALVRMVAAELLMVTSQIEIPNRRWVRTARIVLEVRNKLLLRFAPDQVLRLWNPNNSVRSRFRSGPNCNR